MLRESSGSRYRSVNGYFKKKKINCLCCPNGRHLKYALPLPQRKHFGGKGSWQETWLRIHWSLWLGSKDPVCRQAEVPHTSRNSVMEQVLFRTWTQTQAGAANTKTLYWVNKKGEQKALQNRVQTLRWCGGVHCWVTRSQTSTSSLGTWESWSQTQELTWAGLQEINPEPRWHKTQRSAAVLIGDQPQVQLVTSMTLAATLPGGEKQEQNQAKQCRTLTNSLGDFTVKIVDSSYQ